jgi:hypothetical protein
MWCSIRQQRTRYGVWCVVCSIELTPRKKYGFQSKSQTAAAPTKLVYIAVIKTPEA